MKTSYLASLALAALLASGAAMAQSGDAAIPGTRANQVAQRLQEQEQHINTDAAGGRLSPRQAAKDQAVDHEVARQLSINESKHGGHITRAEQVRLNKKLDKNGEHMRKQQAKIMIAPAPVIAPAP